LESQGQTYTLAGGDVGSTVRLIVTAANSGGSTSLTTAATAVVLPPPPQNGSLPRQPGAEAPRRRST